MSWPMKKLGELLDLCDSGTWGEEDPKGMPLLRSSNMQKGELVLDDLKCIKVPADQRSRYALKEGDILITKSSGSVDHIGKSLFITKEIDGKYGFSNFTQRIRVKYDLVLPKWIYYKISNPATRDFLLNASQTTTGLRNLKIPALKELEIPLPPLSEQKKIVAKLESLLGKVNQAKQLRDEAKASSDNLLSAELHKIFSNGAKAGWEEKEIGEIAKDIKSGFACSKKNEVEKGIVHLRTHNIDTGGHLNFNKFTKIPEKLVDRNAFGLEKGDILFNNTNSTELVGKTALVMEKLPYAFSNHLTRIRVNKDEILPEWLAYIFNTYWRNKYFENICSRWVGQSGINQTMLKKIKILLPSIMEQKMIIARAGLLSAKVEQTSRLQSTAKNDLSTLEQSILSKAFSGSFV